ncbi:hypothetical protein Lal_00026315 [Lupinus albus]|nr:hypothetical protein Lal_00026315 [Lupinus albus]
MRNIRLPYSRGFIAPILGRVPESPGPWFNPNVTCAYHSRVIGHSIKHCRALKYKVQHLVDTKQLTFEDAPPDVHRNPLPNHGNQDKAVPWVYGGDSAEIEGEPPEVNNVAGGSRITRSGRVYGPLDAEKLPTNTGLEIANSSFVREGISEQRPQPFGASLMMAKVMLNKGYQPGKGLGTFGQGIESIVIPQGTKDRHGIGHKPTWKDQEKAAEEKRRGRMARLGKFEYKAGGILNPHISRSFISACFASGTIAVVGEVGPETQTDYVIQCPPGIVLNNWTEEDVTPSTF